MKSWKTTVSGIGMILSGIGAAMKCGFCTEGVTMGIGLVTGGLGLIFARDNNVTSEDAGAK